MDDPKDAYGVQEFCDRNGISRAFLCLLWRRGDGPRFLQLGTRRLISKTPVGVSLAMRPLMTRVLMSPRSSFLSQAEVLVDSKIGVGSTSITAASPSPQTRIA